MVPTEEIWRYLSCARVSENASSRQSAPLPKTTHLVETVHARLFAAPNKTKLCLFSNLREMGSYKHKTVLADLHSREKAD